MQRPKVFPLLLAATFAAIAGTAYGAQRQKRGSVVSQRAWLERRSGGQRCRAQTRATIRHNFRGSTRDCASDGGHLLPAALIATGRIRTERLARITSVELVNNHFAIYTKLGIPCCAIDRGRILGSGRRPVRSTDSPIDPNIVLDPPRVMVMQLRPTSSMTASRSSRDRPANRASSRGRRSDRRLPSDSKFTSTMQRTPAVTCR